jgi:hypothetical protein
MDPALVFRLLVAAPGYQPRVVSKVDPASGLVTVKLDRQDTARLGPKNKLLGRVLDPQGRPVHGAEVDFESLDFEGGGGVGGAVEGVEQVAMTDAQGQFLLASKKSFAAMSVTVIAPSLAKQRFASLASGRQHELRLSRGNALAGRLVLGNKPVAGATVGLVGADRSIERSIGNFVTVSDAQGRFVFSNLPPNNACSVYTLMCEARANGGVAPARKCKIGPDGATTDIGDLVLEPAFRVAGKVVLSDGKPVPKGQRAMLDRAEAWDFLPNVDLAADGSFVFEGVPAESVSLSVNVPDYHFSLSNPSLDRLNGFSVVGRVSGNLDGLLVLQEPGEFKRDANRPYSLDDQPRDKPLRGLPAERLPRR